jgi:hypothetical protein
MVTQGTGYAARPMSNPDYEHWWTLNQKVLGLLLGSMNKDIATQLIGCTMAAAAWAVVHAMFRRVEQRRCSASPAPDPGVEEGGQACC